MYDLYPEWGPAKHRTDDHHDRHDRREHRRQHTGGAVQAALDLRDNGGPRPDDN